MRLKTLFLIKRYMKLLIDGYNLLKYIYGPSIGEQQRRAYTQTINSYARSSQSIKPWIIYDGGSEARPTQEVYGLVTIVYVGWKLTADDYIQDYINTKRHNHEELLLVSSDRQLALYADQHMIPSIDAALFWRLVQRKSTRRTPMQKDSMHTRTVKLSTTHNPDLDELMYNTHSVMPNKDDFEEVTSLIRNTHTTSKTETKLLNIIKKLL